MCWNLIHGFFFFIPYNNNLNRHFSVYLQRRLRKWRARITRQFSIFSIMFSHLHQREALWTVNHLPTLSSALRRKWKLEVKSISWQRQELTSLRLLTSSRTWFDMLSELLSLVEARDMRHFVLSLICEVWARGLLVICQSDIWIRQQGLPQSDLVWTHRQVKPWTELVLFGIIEMWELSYFVWICLSTKQFH